MMTSQFPLETGDRIVLIANGHRRAYTVAGVKFGKTWLAFAENEEEDDDILVYEDGSLKTIDPSCGVSSFNGGDDRVWDYLRVVERRIDGGWTRVFKATDVRF